MVIFEALDEAWSNQPRLSRARRSTRMTGASRDDARWSRGCFHLGSSAGTVLSASSFLSPLLLGLPPGLITLWIYESIYFIVIVRESSTRKLLKNHLWESHIWHFHIIRQFLTCGFALKIGHPQIQSLAFRDEPLSARYWSSRELFGLVSRRSGETISAMWDVLQSRIGLRMWILKPTKLAYNII